jgi:hypothetical protein
MRSRYTYVINSGVQRTGFLQSGFFYGFFNIFAKNIYIHRKFFGLAIHGFFMFFFNCLVIKERNVSDSSTAGLSVADIAGCATWAAGLLAATLAVDLLMIYYLYRAQLGVMGDHIVNGEGEPAGGDIVDEAVPAPLLLNDANDADKGVVESLHGGAKEDGEKQCGKRGRKQHEVWQNLTLDADLC